MEAKLIKTEVNYLLKNEEGVVIAATSLKKLGLALSLKNCQAIERGYDLDELACNTYREFPTDKLQYYNRDTQCFKKRKAFIKGFQKALEILGDKKFSADNIVDAYMAGHLRGMSTDMGENNIHPICSEHLNSLQQTEWDVSFNPEEKDSEGFLILKRL